jgi:hypothetical protein
VITGVKFRLNVEAVDVTDVAEGIVVVGEAAAVLNGAGGADGVGDDFIPRMDESRFSPPFGMLRSGS